MTHHDKKFFPPMVVFACSCLIITFFHESARADHLSRSQCYQYFECVLGKNSALNKCYDNDYLNEIDQTRTMCMKIAQHECKVITGMQGTGRKLTVTRPIDWYQRPTLLDKEMFPDGGGDQDIRIFNYAGWNHCPYRYQGLHDFWCDPEQLRYPPRPWCDVIPTYNISIPQPPIQPSGIQGEFIPPGKAEMLKQTN